MPSSDELRRLATVQQAETAGADAGRLRVAEEARVRQAEMTEAMYQQTERDMADEDALRRGPVDSRY